MFNPTAVNVIEADDGTKAIVVSLDLILPLTEEGVAEVATALLGLAADPTPNPEQDDAAQEDTHE